MAKTTPEQTDASLGDKRETRPDEKPAGAPSPASGTAQRGPQDREPGELDEDALEKVSGGRVSARF